MAVYLVVAVVALQVVMLISVFWLRAMVVPVNVHLPKGQGVTTGGQTPPVNPRPVGPPKPDMPSLPGLAATLGHPALLSVPGVSDKLEQIGNLNDEALAFIHQHAPESAVETLLKAEDIDPRNPSTLKNLAETYNLLNDPPRAKVYWQRLVDLGPGVGTVYAAAKDHVVLMEGHASDPLSDPASLADLKRQIYVKYVEKTPVETVNGQAQFHLRATLACKGAKMPLFDQKKLQPYVIFYQQVADGSLVPDLNQRKGSFDDTFLFWNGKTSEAFGVDYVMPIPGLQGANNTTTGEYYGFVIGIYYDKKLQDVRSEPSDLISRIPLPEEIE